MNQEELKRKILRREAQYDMMAHSINIIINAVYRDDPIAFYVFVEPCDNCDLFGCDCCDNGMVRYKFNSYDDGKTVLQCRGKMIKQ